MEGLKRPNMVSFMDWTNKFDDYSGLQENNVEGDRDLERTRSGMSSLSAHGAESDCSGDDLKRRFEEGGPGMLRLSQYKDVIAQPNGRMGAQGQIYEKHRRLWLQTFNEKEDADIAAFKFRGVHRAVANFNQVESGHLQNRFLSEGEMVDMIQKNTYQDQLSHAKITIPTVAAREPFGLDRAGMAEEDKEVKRGAEADKIERPSGKEKSSREHMFDKAVTPSDVGKLNRLVIPKQHAEKYFPLDTNANEKGLLLNFEDNTGKTWRFRYSYWNSSQSYVLTKGWSRFVKEKKLDAGDIVSFERGTDAQDVERLFISWKRRPCALQPTKAALLRGLSFPSLSTSPGFQYSPFQSHGLNIRAGGGKLGQAQHLNAFPEWMSVVWPANSGGASSRPAPMWAEQMDARQPQPQPQPMRMDMRFHAEEVQNSAREPLDFMQLKASPPEQSWPVQNASVKSSKKGVRLFGVNL